VPPAERVAGAPPPPALSPDNAPPARPGRKRERFCGLPLSLPIRALRGVLGRFFPTFNQAVGQLPDRRSPRHCTYTVGELIWSELVMLLSGVGSRAAMVSASVAAHVHGNLLRLANPAGAILSRTAPHPDTAYVFLQRLEPAALEDLIAAQVKPLLRQHLWDDDRFDGEWLVAIDATWVRILDHEHCPHCLRQRHSDGSVTYAHAVLEAKLLRRNGMAVPLASVPIQNDDPEASKQDCELKALPRLAALLKQRYPKRSICLTMDSLYAVGPVIALCAQYHWSYVAVMKEGRAPAFYPEVLAAAAQSPAVTVTLADGTRQQFSWACNQKYNDHEVHFVRCVQTKPDATAPTTWGWITDHRPDPEMAPLIANDAGRPRWDIEENFNLLKRGLFQQHHDFGSQGHAWYNTWLLAQFACLLLQLIATSDILRVVSAGTATRLRESYQSLANFATSLIEAIKHSADPFTDPPAGFRVHLLPAGP
jgi:hypothetical protein